MLLLSVSLADFPASNDFGVSGLKLHLSNWKRGSSKHIDICYTLITVLQMVISIDRWPANISFAQCLTL